MTWKFKVVAETPKRPIQDLSDLGRYEDQTIREDSAPMGRDVETMIGVRNTADRVIEARNRLRGLSNLN